MKRQADSADLCPPHPHHPQTGFSSLSVKPVLLCFLLNFSSSLQSQLDFIEGCGLRSRTSCRKEQKTRKNNNKKKKTKGRHNRDSEKPALSWITPTCKTRTERNSQKTANFGWKSLLFSFLWRKCNEWLTSGMVFEKRFLLLYIHHEYIPTTQPSSQRRWRLTLPKIL